MGKKTKGFLNRAAGEEEADEFQSLEEQYEKLFPKIGRDFVYKEDLFRILDNIMSVLDPLGLSPIDFTSDQEAKKRAREYKSLLDSGKDGSKRFKDLIDMDDD